MKLLLRSVRIIQGEEKGKPRRMDILIENGIIRNIASKINAVKNTREITSKDLCVSPGWLDMKSNFRDPGNEVKEEIATGIMSATAGGFTGVVLMPSTDPPIQSKADIEYLLAKASRSIVDVYPAAALSVDLKGRDITEMGDLKNAGAVAFTDDRNPVTDSGLMLRALQYSRNINSLVISFATDPGINGQSIVNEGKHAIMAGFKGGPSLAEEIFVTRDLMITDYTSGKLHLSTITTSEAIRLVKQAKKKGINVTAEVAAHHLFYDDSVIEGYDTNLKVKPPLRSSADVKDLRKAVLDGTIDVICSDHSPQDIESKDTEYDFASFGMIGLETAYSAANTSFGKNADQEVIVNCLAINPRRILGLDVPVIKKGEKANLTIFDPSINWKFSRKNIRSKSFNTPFIGTEFTGKVIGVVNNGKANFN